MQLRIDLKDSRFFNENKSNNVKPNSAYLPDIENHEFCPFFA